LDASPSAVSDDAGGASDGGDYCSGAFLCDEFQRTAVDEGTIPWRQALAAGGTIDIESDPARGRALVADIVQADAKAIAGYYPKLPITGKVGITVSLTYEILQNAASLSGFTDLLVMGVAGMGFANLVIFADGKPHLSTNCTGCTGATGWSPLLPAAANSGVHNLVYTTRFTGDGRAGMTYTFDQDPAREQAVSLPAVPSGNMVDVELGANHAEGQSGAFKIRYERISIRLANL
jgi:hypothetical protein